MWILQICTEEIFDVVSTEMPQETSDSTLDAKGRSLAVSHAAIEFERAQPFAPMNNSWGLGGSLCLFHVGAPP